MKSKYIKQLHTFQLLYYLLLLNIKMFTYANTARLDMKKGKNLVKVG